MKKHYNKRWFEQRWDARQPERLEHIQIKRKMRATKEANENETEHGDIRVLQDHA